MVCFIEAIQKYVAVRVEDVGEAVVILECTTMNPLVGPPFDSFGERRDMGDDGSGEKVAEARARAIDQIADGGVPSALAT